jgi:hypothetical protein
MKKEADLLAAVIRLVFSLYSGIGSVYAPFFYVTTAMQLLLSGDPCGFMGWVFIIGPFVSPLLGVFWPVALYHMGLGGL